MADFDSHSAECAVFTFKDGLLSPVAHDLRLTVTRFSLTVALAPDRSLAIEGRFDARSLAVQTVMRDGREAPGVMGQRDSEKIARTIREDVLASERHPEIVFRSQRVEVIGERATIEGTLTLCGRSKALTIQAHQADGRWVAEVALHQPDFGIKPYSAMFGTLKIKPEVRVRVTLPADRIAGVS